jgi:hypothetical protein
LWEIEGGHDFVDESELVGELMRCDSVSWHFSTCAHHFQAPEILHAGTPARESLKAGDLLHYALICTSLDIDSTVARLASVTPRQLLLGSSIMNSNKKRYILISGPNIR